MIQTGRFTLKKNSSFDLSCNVGVRVLLEVEAEGARLLSEVLGPGPQLTAETVRRHHASEALQTLQHAHATHAAVGVGAVAVGLQLRPLRVERHQLTTAIEKNGKNQMQIYLVVQQLLRFLGRGLRDEGRHIWEQTLPGLRLFRRTNGRRREVKRTHLRAVAEPVHESDSAGCQGVHVHVECCRRFTLGTAGANFRQRLIANMRLNATASTLLQRPNMEAVLASTLHRQEADVLLLFIAVDPLEGAAIGRRATNKVHHAMLIQKPGEAVAASTRRSDRTPAVVSRNLTI